MRKMRKGFTLLELVVVIVIIAILSAIAIPAFTAVINKSKKASAQATADAVVRGAKALAAFDQVQTLTDDTYTAAFLAGESDPTMGGKISNETATGFDVTVGGQTVSVTYPA